MKAPEFKVINDQLEIKGNFEFKISEPMIMGDDLKPYRKIEFHINPEVPHTIMQHNVLGIDSERLVDLYVEQMKEDFEKFIKENI